ncbi:hypothetical protein GALL_367610 [mine drainage metagenome]|jgi:hypothetical protein|uniref:DUF4197 domain-containing protein n=1 Tax=mine drainage metagenome TaxID=410659 RepID=A0A1J5QZY4_9ZZZZ
MKRSHTRCARLASAALLAALALAAPSAQAFDVGSLQGPLGQLLGGAPASAPGAAPAASGNGAGPADGAVAALSDAEVGRGLKAALSRGADVAVRELGRENGFYGNAKWRIPLPPALARAEQLMRVAGMGAQADALDLAINRAAERAVPQARTLLVDAVRSMTLADAKGILTGGDQAATDYFRRKTEAPLTQRFLPIVARSTAQVGLAQSYDRFAGQAAQFGLLRQDQASIEQYVTAQALSRLYQAIGEQERAIRADPLGTGSKLLGRVFGAALGR